MYELYILVMKNSSLFVYLQFVNSSHNDVSVASVWAEFDIPNSRHVPLLDATPVSLWIYAKPDLKPGTSEKSDRPNRKLLSQFYGESKKDDVGLYLLAVCNQLVSVQLDHHQLLFLLRYLDHQHIYK